MGVSVLLIPPLRKRGKGGVPLATHFAQMDINTPLSPLRKR